MRCPDPPLQPLGGSDGRGLDDSCLAPLAAPDDRQRKELGRHRDHREGEAESAMPGRVVPGAEPCEACGGTGIVQAEDAHGELYDARCSCGASEDEDERELYGYPAAHGRMWLCEDRPETCEALLASGFIVYRDASRDGFIGEGLIVGIDGGGYSFFGAHWIPLRARLARHAAESIAEKIPLMLVAVLLDEAGHEGETRRAAEILLEKGSVV